jgi:Ca2+-binding EF-hand superfamily protein
MSKLDIDNMMNDLDFDKDGKISIDEFHKWWLSGRKGHTGTMK